MVGQATQNAVLALKNRDLNMARRIYEGDVRINKKKLQVENDCLTLIATQQPLAGDLRTLASVLEISTELERMADRVTNICERTVFVSTGKLVELDISNDEMRGTVGD